MNSKQTIDGVPRELLSDVFDELTDWNTPVATKLRALLDAPATGVCRGCFTEQPPAEPVELGYFEHRQSIAFECCPIDTHFIWTLPGDRRHLIPQRFKVLIQADQQWNGIAASGAAARLSEPAVHVHEWDINAEGTATVCHCGAGSSDEPAAQPHGEQIACMPVERCYDVRAKMIIAFNEAKKAGGDLDDALDAAYKSALRYSPNPMNTEQPAPFQSRVQPWLMECFGMVIAADRQERNHRFLEEALELVQSSGCTEGEAHQLVEYVYGRPAGDPVQEVGGVMVTLAALCLAHGMDMHAAGETELARIWTKVDQIRAKQAAKPSMSPLPGAYPDREQPAPVVVVLPERKTWDGLRATACNLKGEAWNACLDEVTRLNAKS